MNKKVLCICLLLALAVTLLVGGLFLTEHLASQRHIGHITATQEESPN